MAGGKTSQVFDVGRAVIVRKAWEKRAFLRHYHRSNFLCSGEMVVFGVMDFLENAE